MLYSLLENKKNKTPCRCFCFDFLFVLTILETKQERKMFLLDQKPMTVKQMNKQVLGVYITNSGYVLNDI